MANLFDMTFTFNSSTSQNGNNAVKLFLDNNGNVIDKSKVDYGIYNKAINISIKKLLYIHRHKLGLGDIIDFITKTFYIKNLIVYLTKGNCGCEERRIRFNKYYIPWYTVKIRDLYFQDEEILNYIKNFKTMNIKLKEYKESNPMKNQSGPIKNNLQNSNQIDVKNKKPIEPVKLKKSCGCSKRNG